MTFALPLAFAAYRVWSDRLSPSELTAIVALVGVDLLLTKVVGLIPFGIVLLTVLFSRHPVTSSSSRARTIHSGRRGRSGSGGDRRSLRHRRLVRRAGPARVLPAEKRGTACGASSTGPATGELAPAATIVGQLALLSWLIRHRSFALATALAAKRGGKLVRPRHRLRGRVGAACAADRAGRLGAPDSARDALFTHGGGSDLSSRSGCARCTVYERERCCSCSDWLRWCRRSNECGACSGSAPGRGPSRRRERSRSRLHHSSSRRSAPP